jgi:hypothetical protein
MTSTDRLVAGVIAALLRPAPRLYEMKAAFGVVIVGGLLLHSVQRSRLFGLSFAGASFFCFSRRVRRAAQDRGHRESFRSAPALNLFSQRKIEQSITLRTARAFAQVRFEFSIRAVI